MQKRSVFAAIAAVAVVSTAVYADVIFDTESGTGFVGKGDVQTALNYNNKQLQDNAASLAFTYERVTETATTWTCDRDGGPQTQERANTTTTSIQGVVSVVARERNQITGFYLTGFADGATTETENDGPAIGSCPTFWTAIDLVVGETQVISGGLYVNGVLLQ